jgi:RHH-type rel operon transcriptional repressor/antitoxin RelB
MQKGGGMPTSVRLPEEIEQRLNVLAAETGRSKAFYIREAIQEHLDVLEDIYLAEQRLADIKAGRSRTYTLDEVEQRLGLAD